MSSGYLNYGAQNIIALDEREKVRVDPTTYIDSLGISGIKNMVTELVDNVVDESNVEGAPLITLNLQFNRDGSVVVEDNARGIPVETHPVTGEPAIYLILERLQAGGKIKNRSAENRSSGYKLSVGTHGMGSTVVNYLSDYFDVTIKRKGDPNIYHLRYEKGIRVQDLHVIGQKPIDESGTRIEFLYDREMFTLTDEFQGEVDYPHNIEEWKSRLDNYCLFNSNLNVVFKYDTPHTQGEYTVSSATNNKLVLLEKVKLPNTEVVSITTSNYMPGLEYEYEVDFAIIDDSDNQELRKNAVNGLCLVNGGGSHVHAFEQTFVQVINDYLISKGLIDSGKPFDIYDIRPTLSYYILIRKPDPHFRGQVKSYLDEPKVAQDLMNKLEPLIIQSLPKFIEEYLPILQLKYQSKLAYLASKQELKKKQYKKVKKDEIGDLLRNKFWNCTKSRNCQLYIVEGDSAGSYLKAHKDDTYQALYVLQGKVINVLVNDPTNDKQFTALRTIIDMGKFSEYYIVTDADADGMHIRNLLIALFREYKPEIIQNGQLRIIDTPLYKITYSNGREDFAYSETEKEEMMKRPGFKSAKRFKGLAELEELQGKFILEEPTITIVRLNDYVETLGDVNIVDELMGSKVTTRALLARQFYAAERFNSFLENQKHLLRSQNFPLNNGNFELEEQLLEQVFDI